LRQCAYAATRDEVTAGLSGEKQGLTLKKSRPHRELGGGKCVKTKRGGAESGARANWRREAMSITEDWNMVPTAQRKPF